MPYRHTFLPTKGNQKMYMLSQQFGCLGMEKPHILNHATWKDWRKAQKDKPKLFPKTFCKRWIPSPQSLPLFAASTQGRTCTTFCHLLYSLPQPHCHITDRTKFKINGGFKSSPRLLWHSSNPSIQKTSSENTFQANGNKCIHHSPHTRPYSNEKLCRSQTLGPNCPHISK